MSNDYQFLVNIDISVNDMKLSACSRSLCYCVPGIFD